MVKKPLWNELSHDYVGPAVTENIYGPVGLIRARAGFSAVDLFVGRKSKIFQEQNVKEFQFYIRMLNFRPLGSIIKKCLRVADPHKGVFSNLLLYKCYNDGSLPQQQSHIYTNDKNSFNPLLPSVAYMRRQE